MKLKLFVITFLSITLPSISYGASGSTGAVEIKTIRAGGGFVRITGETEFKDPSNCNGAGSNRNATVILREGTDSYSEQVSFILSAKMAGKKIQFWVNGCENDSGKQYPKALYTYIQD